MNQTQATFARLMEATEMFAAAVRKVLDVPSKESVEHMAQGSAGNHMATALAVVNLEARLAAIEAVGDVQQPEDEHAGRAIDSLKGAVAQYHEQQPKKKTKQ